MNKKRIIISIASLIVIASIVVGVLLLTGTIKQPSADQVRDQLIETGKGQEKDAVAAENAGKTDEALKLYEKSQTAYEKAGDDIKAANMETKVMFMKQFLSEIEKNKTEPTTHIINP